MLRRRLVRTPAHPSSVPAVRPVRPTSGGPARRPIWPSLEMDEVDHENAEGDKSHGYWRVIAVDAPHSLEVQDGFADDTGAPNPDLPTTTMRVVLSGRAASRRWSPPRPSPAGKPWSSWSTWAWRTACAPPWPKWTRSSPPKPGAPLPVSRWPGR